MGFRNRILFAAAILALAGSLRAEGPYGFRRRLESVHRPAVRLADAVPSPEEFALSDGATLAVPETSEFLRRVGFDFADYLSVSMSVSARVVRGGAGTLAARVDGSLPPRQYRVEVTADGVTLLGADERAVAQAFYHLEDLMNLRRAPFLRRGREIRTPRFDVRMTHSGYGYMMYPDAFLNALAHAGMTSVILYVGGIDRAEKGRVCDFRAIIRRASAYGLDAYLYSEIPAFCHPDDGEAPFDESYGALAAAYPEAKGIIFVGESCDFPTKDPRACSRRLRQQGDRRPSPASFPCSDYPDWLRAIQKAIGRRAPDMRTLFWTYNWGGRPEAERLPLVENLPQETVLIVTFEMFERRRLANGMEAPTADYSLSVVGPGRSFTSEAAVAKRRGLTLFTQANAGGRTWDFGTAPYEPCPHRWNLRWQALCRAHDDYGLSGVMECHHYGWTPTFLAELEKEAYTEGGLPFEKHVRLVAERDFGAAHADAALGAWKLWSDVLADYVATDANQYGPFRCGPAYPFSAGRGVIDGGDFPVTAQSLVGTAFIRMNYLGCGFTRSTEDLSVPYMKREVELLSSMAGRFEKGAAAFAAMPGEAARRQALLGRYLAASCRTAANVKRGWIAAAESDEPALIAAARGEYENARAALPLVEEDSQLGFEPAMDYVGGPDQIRWKLRLMERLYGSRLQP